MSAKKKKRRTTKRGKALDSMVMLVEQPAPVAAPDPDADLLQAAREAHAARFAAGDVGRVQTVTLELDWLRRNGALVDVDVTGMSMLAGTISLRELGFPEDVAIAAIGQVIMSLADSKQLPEFIIGFNRRSESVSMAFCRPVYLRSAKSLESQVRQALGRFSYRKGLERVLGSYYWIPVTAYEAWKADFDQRHAALEEVKANLAADMPGYRHEVAAGWRLIAREAYAAICKRVDGFAVGEAEFADRLVQAATGHLPTPESVAGITLDYNTPVLLVPSQVEAELARRDAIHSRREIEAAKAAAEAAEQWSAQRQVEAETFQAMREREAEAEARIQMERDRATFERRRLEAMHEAELEHARRQIAEMESPFTQVLESLRAEIFETVQAVLVSIRKHGRILGKTAEQAENLIANFRLLNVAGDQDLERLLNDLHTALGQKGVDSARDAAAVNQALTAIAEETAEAARNVARRLEPSQASMILI